MSLGLNLIQRCQTLEGAASLCGSLLDPVSAGVCFVVSGLSRLSPSFFPSRSTTLHHSLQEESGVSVSAQQNCDMAVCGVWVEGSVWRQVDGLFALVSPP